MGFYSDSFFGQGGGGRLKSKSEVGHGRRGAREMRLGSREYSYTIVKMRKKLAFALFKKIIQHFAIIFKLIREMPFF